MLLGGSYGALVGSALDAADALDSASIIEQVCSKLEDGDIALIALVQEKNEEIFDSKLSKFDATIIRHDAAVVAVEVKEAAKVQQVSPGRPECLLRSRRFSRSCSHRSLPRTCQRHREHP